MLNWPLVLLGWVISTSECGVVKRAGSFVVPTHGSADSLTLTTFVTNAASLHYAVVATGQDPLDASAIKAAAIEETGLATTGSRYKSLPDRYDDRASASTTRDTEAATDVVFASTITVTKAHTVETTISSLTPNTSYDVYFVAEVIGSNGVFGPVKSVLRSTTHPEPPQVSAITVSTENATAEAVVVAATLSSPGKMYAAVVPSGTYSIPMTREELADSKSLDASQRPVFALQDCPDWHQLTFKKSIVGLTPATLYDVFVVTKAPGDGGVYSDIVRVEKAVRTHALPPEVEVLSVVPRNGSSHELVVAFKLVFGVGEMMRVTTDTLSLFTYKLYYNASIATTSTAVDAASTGSPKQNGGSLSSSGYGVQGRNDTVFETLIWGNFSTIDELLIQSERVTHITISGLQNGTEYQVTMAAESVGSNGLFGAKSISKAMQTHQTAPAILAAKVEATYGSVNALTAEVEMSRPGTIHYLVTSGRIHGEALRVENISRLESVVREQTSPGDVVFTGVVVWTGGGNSSSDKAVNGPLADTHYSRSFEIGGLQDAAQYSIVVMAETTGSFGVFGLTYPTVLEARTHENASEIELIALEPADGSTTTLTADIRMSKPSDLLHCCVKESGNSQLSAPIERCHGMNESEFELIHPQRNIFRFSVGNLTENTEYDMRLYAENALRNGVFSDRNVGQSVKTHQRAPGLYHAVANPVGGSTSRIRTDVEVEDRCLLHYVVQCMSDREDPEDAPDFSDPTVIVKHSTNTDMPPHRLSRSVEIADSGRMFVTSARTSFDTTNLKANTTYLLHVMTESSAGGNASGVFGEVMTTNVTTFAMAPTIALATADPVAGSTDSILISVNLSHPGIVHYFVSDADYADPAAIKSTHRHSSLLKPHILRGEFQVRKEDIVMEIINGTNDTRPTDPPVFTKNLTINRLNCGVMYHVSLTTETFGSGGVFGEFPPPILVNTHPQAPQILPESLVVRPVPASSSSIEVNFRLERFGEVHYALFFRGLITDMSETVFAKQRAKRDEIRTRLKAELVTAGTYNATNFSASAPPQWPPVSSNFTLSNLNGSSLKEADLDELGAGVWENGTISVSREDVMKGIVTHKVIEKLPPNGVFDLCLVSETAGGCGIFNWNGSDHACHRIITHADYTNQSVLFDEVDVRPIPGRTDGIQVSLIMSKLPSTPSYNIGDDFGLDDLARQTGRVPHFILIDGKSGRREFSSLHSSRHRHGFGQVFKDAQPGQNHVAAAGTIANVTDHNDSFVVLQHNVYGLTHNRPYFFFFAYETAGSDGVFTKINPHKHRPNDSRTENDGIEVVTLEAAPRLSNLKAYPTPASTTCITVKFDIACDACDRAIVHALVYPEGCSAPPMDILRSKSFGTSDIEATEDSEDRSNLCSSPLARRRIKIAMPEHQTSRKDVEEIVASDLTPNTTYTVFVATETVNSSGVMSDQFEELRARTFTQAPTFNSIELAPRKGSTTELLLTFALNRPGEVHYMIGKADNHEFNVASALNISAKHQDGRNGPNYHDYPRDVVRLRRSTKVSTADEVHTEVLDYLEPGTAYSAYAVVEAPEGNGVYSDIHYFIRVSTFHHAPVLLAHAVNPTPASTTSLTVGFRLDTPGSVYFSVISVDLWDRTSHVSTVNSKYGNRLAMEERLVAQDSIVIDESSMQVTGPGSRDSGWREKQLRVPYSGANYTVYLVTETTDSEGVYGIVARHQDVRSHPLAPAVLNLSVSATDARMDSLTVNVRLTDVGHIHYVALPHGLHFSPTTDYSASPHGVIRANESTCASGDHESQHECSVAKTFLIENLQENTWYDIYIRAETLDSYGVFGEWVESPADAQTHGLPPDVLQAIECRVASWCESFGRETVNADG